MFEINLFFNDGFLPELSNIKSKHKLKSPAKIRQNLPVTVQGWKEFVIVQLQ